MNQKEFIKKLVISLADEVAFSSKWDISETSVKLLNRFESLEVLNSQQFDQEMRDDLIKAGVRIAKK